MFYAYEENGELKTVYAAKPPVGVVCEIPVDIEKDDFPYLVKQPVAVQSTGVGPESFNSPMWTVVVDQTAKSAALAEKNKVTSVDSAYKTMSDEIDAQMYEVFRTLKPEYATAEYNTWKDMLDRPAAYASLGLKVDHQVNATDNTEMFSPGSALDTAQKVLDFAQRKIQLAQVYGTFRMQRIQQFKDQKEQIQNS